MLSAVIPNPDGYGPSTRCPLEISVSCRIDGCYHFIRNADVCYQSSNVNVQRFNYASANKCYRGWRMPNGCTSQWIGSNQQVFHRLACTVCDAPGQQKDLAVSDWTWNLSLSTSCTCCTLVRVIRRSLPCSGKLRDVQPWPPAAWHASIPKQS